MRWALAGSAAPRRGFSLIELTVVLMVVAVLAAISILTYNQVNSRAHTKALDASLTNFARAHTQSLMYENMSSRAAAEQVLAELSDGSSIVLSIADVGVVDPDGPVVGALVGPAGEPVVLAAGTQNTGGPQNTDDMYVVSARFATGPSMCRQIVMPSDVTPQPCGPTSGTQDPPVVVPPTSTPGSTHPPAPPAPPTTQPPAPTTTVPEVPRQFSVMVRPLDNRIYWWHSFWDGSGGMGEWVAEFSFSNMWMRHQYLDMLVTRTHSNGAVSTVVVNGFYVPAGGAAPSRSWSNSIGAAFTVPHGITRVEVSVTRIVTSDAQWQPLVSTPASGVSGAAAMDWPSLPL